MRRLSFIILLVVLSVSLLAQKSPHGDSFKTNCDDCHKTDGWKVDLKTVSFDHSGTKFPLIGQHLSVNCKQCHTSLAFANAKTGCNDCHIDMHEQTLGNDCARCHTPNSWVVTNITRLHQQSRFPLIGPHTTADCSDCHKNLLSSSAQSSPAASLLRFDQLGIECYDCHKDNYTATSKPNHVVSNYSTNCTDCHSINAFAWEGAGINHNFFPLTGGHDINDCKTCHTSGSFSKIPSECASCHINNFNQTTSPNHSVAGISNDCATCHTTIPGWKPAKYPSHSNLTGVHIPIANECATCHKGNYTNLPKTCFDCHSADYTQSANPSHTAVQFPKTCEDCHSQTAWKPSTWNHDTQYFPIYSGNHQGEWNTCTDCHTTTNNYAQFSCIDCHDHNKTEMDKQHQGDKNYTWTSAACYSCHPKGKS